MAAVPPLGAPAPDAPPLGPVHGPAVVAFLRHVGCPFAEATMRAISSLADERQELAWIAVSHARLEATDRWCAEVGTSRHVRVVIDEGRTAYAGWGLGRTSLGHFMGRHSLAAVGSLARRGIRNRHPVGTRWQRAGTFAVDASGLIAWRHLPSHAGDLPDLEQALAVLSDAAAPRA